MNCEELVGELLTRFPTYQVYRELSIQMEMLAKQLEEQTQHPIAKKSVERMREDADVLAMLYAKRRPEG